MTALLLDAYGTLFDVHAVAGPAEKLFPGSGAALAALWRERQIDYTRLRSLAGRYRDFRAVTGDALDFSADALGLGLDAAGREQLLSAYERLPAFADVGPALATLISGGTRCGILSNGTPKMLEALLGAAGLGSLLWPVLSVDAVQKFKPAPETYALGPIALGVPAAEIVFVSSNGWDVAGAAWSGYTTFWVNRGGRPAERLGVTATATGRSLDDLVRWLAARSP
jgi:2-haloacid dehalogenase